MHVLAGELHRVNACLGAISGLNGEAWGGDSPPCAIQKSNRCDLIPQVTALQPLHIRQV